MPLTEYPSITPENFSSACQALETHCLDNLDGTGWLSVRCIGQELKITQRRRVKRGVETEAEVEDPTKDLEDTGTEEIMDDDEDLENVISVAAAPQASENWEAEVMDIDFSITLSPTYSVPVLWIVSPYFKSVNRLHDALLPQHLDEAVRSVGVMGGISQAYHPVSDLPAFFIHPCKTHAAISSVNDGRMLSAEEYLLIWLGVIGSSVGLHVPSKFVGKTGD